MRISTIIPAYNEQQALAQVVREYENYSEELIVVDDGSSDLTPQIAGDLANKSDKVKVIHHQTNRGKAQALRTGVKQATGEIIVFTDADLTYPATSVPRLVEKVKGGADLVLGSRMQRGAENMSPLNRLGNSIFSFLTSLIGATTLNDAQTGLRAVRKDKFYQLAVEAKGLEFETKMTIKASRLGYRIEEIPISYRERVGSSKLRPIKDGLRMLRSLVSVLTSCSPDSNQRSD